MVAGTNKSYSAYKGDHPAHSSPGPELGNYTFNYLIPLLFSLNQEIMFYSKVWNLGQIVMSVCVSIFFLSTQCDREF
jgi:hypothetical protein